METGTQETTASAVYRQLDQVYDPELDQPLTELGFIGGVDITGGMVTVQFRLPTYWCAANFAFMMATDIRDRVSELPWVHRVEVRLQDHFLEQEINEGVNRGRTFQATFPDWATGDVDELRETFRAKAFEVRQERLLRWLCGHHTLASRRASAAPGRCGRRALDRALPGHTAREGPRRRSWRGGVFAA